MLLVDSSDRGQIHECEVRLGTLVVSSCDSMRLFQPTDSPFNYIANAVDYAVKFVPDCLVGSSGSDNVDRAFGYRLPKRFSTVAIFASDCVCAIAMKVVVQLAMLKEVVGILRFVSLFTRGSDRQKCSTRLCHHMKLCRVSTPVLLSA